MDTWIAVDWGTSNLRAWKMGADGRAVEEAGSDAGMGTLDRDGFEPALLALIEPWLTEGEVTPAVACGMVGARQGWVEAAYARAPCPPVSAGGFVRAPVKDPRFSFHIVPGVQQSGPDDVMRGEETQVAGFLKKEPDFDGVLCLPGTHTKWVHISAGEIVSFNTFMTGEMFALLSKNSVLRHSVTSDGWDEAEFDAAVETALSKPEQAAANLFRIRAGSLLSGLEPAAARARLSGLLVGMELAGSKPYWLGRDLVLIGNKSLSANYRRALSLCGLEAREADASEMTLSGLSQAHADLTKAGVPL